MKAVLFKSKDRGTADHGWLKANFFFSFAHYYNPDKINFGALRVLNDDYIQGGMGFGTHPHDNMEIISIPLKGTMKHRDSMSNKWIPLHTGEVQIMSAGSGLQHSEMNNSPNEEVNMFQIWIIPNKENVTPRYDQKAFEISERQNKLQVLVSNIDNAIEGSLTIHQNAKISRVDLENDSVFNYSIDSEGNGVFIAVIEGEVSVNNEKLLKRDAIGVYETPNVVLQSKTASQLLFIEVPMYF